MLIIFTMFNFQLLLDKAHLLAIMRKKLCNISIFTFSVPYGGGGVVDEPAVSVHQVGHVLRQGEAGARDGQQLGTPRHPQLQHRLARHLPAPSSPVPAHHRLQALDVTEVRHMGGLQKINT